MIWPNHCSLGLSAVSLVPSELNHALAPLHPDHCHQWHVMPCLHAPPMPLCCSSHFCPLSPCPLASPRCTDHCRALPRPFPPLHTPGQLASLPPGHAMTGTDAVHAHAQTPTLPAASGPASPRHCSRSTRPCSLVTTDTLFSPTATHSRRERRRHAV